ncbi:Zuotin [Nosema bombycis CQ1]|uniref:Zuotin n=1 Tax=Nosema bombycis (strain CQ1 / CVCC 102059) TaxID=578461 RepID=R0KUD1_NOSB1|nr:Zuotin [Nosema bombycis CQ1]|eukprot:EOB14421.1 Zuotin [Nosema bombycis CQ1]
MSLLAFLNIKKSFFYMWSPLFIFPPLKNLYFFNHQMQNEITKPSEEQNEITKYSKPTGEQKEIHDKYLDSRNIIKLYSVEDLKCISKVDLYLLMDLDQYRDKDIPNNVLNHVYKQKKRQYHPDISRGPREAYLLVEKARDILGDKRLRKIYDSSFFNVQIPEDRIYQEDEFFEIFGKIFKEYARFSNEPVPQMDSNPISFYNFYLKSYKTNRIYIPIDEFFNLSKEERLDYTKKNQDKLTKLKNQDILQLKEIIRIAQKRDPRINSIINQIEEMRLEQEKEWSPEEIGALKKFCILLGKTKKNKWEIITEKVTGVTKKKRSVKEVMKKAEGLGFNKK